MRCGAAAGFAAVFGTPFSAVVFAFEALSQKSFKDSSCELTKFKTFGNIFFVAGCSFLAHVFAKNIFGVSHSTLSAKNPDVSIHLIFFLCMLSVFFIILSKIHKLIIGFMREKMELLMSKSKFSVFVLSFLFGLVLCVPQLQLYKNLGLNFVDHFFGDGANYLQIGYLDWLSKWTLTLVSVVFGYKGGEVTPLLAIGSLLSFSLSSAFPWMTQSIAVAGYSGMFAAVFRVPIVGAVLAIESFGLRGWSGAVVCLFLLIFMRLSNFYLHREEI
jgi:H+/Cl- antiporter ClcA